MRTLKVGILGAVGIALLIVPALISGAAADTLAWRALIIAGEDAAAGGDKAAAERRFQDAVAVSRDAVDCGGCLAASLRSLSDFYDDEGRIADAAKFLKLRLVVRRAELPPGHPELAPDLYDAAGFFMEHDNLPRAAVYLEEVLLVDLDVFGPDHPLIGDSHLFLAFLYEQSGNTAAAARSYRAAIKVYERIFPATHADLGRAMSRYADLLTALGQQDRASQFAVRAAATEFKRLSN
ncbi:MAG: tetratricopeptide repeat protein [Alphaproteobacteria bacterium]|nr:tetratricopeptide repeat protein [Alphaproteobacteria bacterium]